LPCQAKQGLARDPNVPAEAMARVDDQMVVVTERGYNGKEEPT
jgi:hypothetical protein